MSDFEKLINANDLIEWIMETYPDWCIGAVRSIVDHIEDMPSAQPELATDTISRQEAIRLVHSVLYEMRVDAAATDIEKPMSKEDKLLLRVNKVVCTKLKELPSTKPELATDTISRQTTIDAFYKYPNIHWTTLDVLAKIKALPSTEPVRMKGKWCVTPDGRLVCSRCYETPINRIIVDGNLIYDMTPIRKLMKFCPNCGASMSEGEEE